MACASLPVDVNDCPTSRKTTGLSLSVHLMMPILLLFEGQKRVVLGLFIQAVALPGCISAWRQPKPWIYPFSFQFPPLVWMDFLPTLQDAGKQPKFGVDLPGLPPATNKPG